MILKESYFSLWFYHFSTKVGVIRLMLINMLIKLEMIGAGVGFQASWKKKEGGKKGQT